MKSALAVLMLELTVIACSTLSTPTLIPKGGSVVESTEPKGTTELKTPEVPVITVDQLKNAEYQLVAQNSHQRVKLVNGSYQNGNDPTSVDYVSVNLAELMAFGDLNGDGVSDAAVLLAENYGGTGVFVSVIAMLNQNGQPVQAASELVDDRPILKTITIQDGQIFLDVTVHGPNDPGCCAAQPNKRVYIYEAGRLVIAGLSMITTDRRVREITIDSPLEGKEVSWPLTVTGHFTIAPFENNLIYSVYDMNHNQLAVGPLIVTPEQPGGPGTFSFPLDLSKTSAIEALRIQVEDSSPADGTILALATVKVNVK